MVIISTSAIDVSIQAVSPLLMAVAGAAAGAAVSGVGCWAAAATVHSDKMAAAHSTLFIQLRLETIPPSNQRGRAQAGARLRSLSIGNQESCQCCRGCGQHTEAESVAARMPKN